MNRNPSSDGLRESTSGWTWPRRAVRRGLFVLIVDPDQDSARRLAGALRQTDGVSLAGSAREALAIIQQRTPDLIVSELDLPDATGVELITRIHNAPTTRHVLLLVATARRSVGDKIAAFQAGADDYLVKPVDPQQFAHHVEMLSRFQQVIGRE
ncbi:MAG TPA: response regulator [Ktedonobacterales bacterium]